MQLKEGIHGADRVWFVAIAIAALCLLGGAPAAHANGGKTIATASGVDLNKPNRGSLYDSNFYSGFSAAFYVAQLNAGDRVSMKTVAQDGVTPPCQILYMPGTDDSNVGATAPILDPASATRKGSVDSQRWVATDTGFYVLAMTNADIFLSGPAQCLDAPSGSPFTFTVKVSHEGGESSSKQSGGSGNGGGGVGSSGGTRVVKPGQSLWVIAQSVVGRASIAQIAFQVRRLWRLNSARIGTGNPDLIYAGQELRLK
jgi:nucleoid-associated protein YgaU